MAKASIARFVILATSLIALILIVGILLVVLGANNSNDLVHAVRDAAHFLAGPFNNLFTLDNNKVEKAVNWGLAAIVWLVVGRLIARLLLRR